MDKCLVPNCQRGPETRGLCHVHYCIASKLVRKHITTWTELERCGKSLEPYHSRANKTKAWFLECVKTD